MKTYFVIMACGLMALLAGCQEGEEIESESEELRMSIEASIGGSVASRYAGDEPNSVAFADEDAIGMFVSDETSQVKWTYEVEDDEDAGTWKPEKSIYWKDKQASYTFYAYYPYQSKTASSGNIVMPDLSSQSGSMGDLGKYDFLVATVAQTYGTDGTVSFTGDNAFTHVSALMAMTIKGDGDLASSTITEISISGTNLATSSTYSFATGKGVVLNATGVDNISTGGITRSVGAKDQMFYFVVNKGASRAVTLTVKYTTGNNNYEAKTTLTANDNFAGGTQYGYTLKISDGVLKIVGNEIEDWTAGESIDDITINGEQQEESAS